MKILIQELPDQSLPVKKWQMAEDIIAGISPGPAPPVGRTITNMTSLFLSGVFFYCLAPFFSFIQIEEQGRCQDHQASEIISLSI